MSMPYLSAISMDRGSGGLPSCQPLVPALSTSQGRFAAFIFSFRMPSARGDLQIFPRQILKNFIYSRFISVNFVLEIFLDVLIYTTSLNSFRYETDFQICVIISILTIEPALHTLAMS